MRVVYDHLPPPQFPLKTSLWLAPGQHPVLAASPFNTSLGVIPVQSGISTNSPARDIHEVGANGMSPIDDQAAIIRRLNEANQSPGQARKKQQLRRPTSLSVVKEFLVKR
jgi:hypothetical protein